MHANSLAVAEGHLKTHPNLGITSTARRSTLTPKALQLARALYMLSPLGWAWAVRSLPKRPAGSCRGARGYTVPRYAPCAAEATYSGTPVRAAGS